jgi:succinylglutamate desuccinylase
VANPLARERGRREGERNLNRRLLPTEAAREYEDHVANWLCPLLARHDALLDLHSFHTAGQPFALVGPEDNAGPLEPFSHAGAEAALALRLGVRRIVHGWLRTYAAGVERRRAVRGDRPSPPVDADDGVGTTEYMRRTGGWGLTLECGQHDDPRAPQVAHRAILATLAHLRLLDAPAPPPAEDVESLHLFDVVDKLHDDDRFSRAWSSFDPVRAGEVIGTRGGGAPVRAAADGRIVFPNPAAVAGQEWFYLARPDRRFGEAGGSGRTP